MRRLGLRFALGISALVLAPLAAIGAGSGVASAASPTYDQYQVINVHSGLCLEPRNNTVSSGTPVVQVTCTASNFQQHWWHTHVNTNGTVTYQPFLQGDFGVSQYVINENHSYCLGPASPSNGTAVVLKPVGSCAAEVKSGNASNATMKHVSLCLAISGSSTSQNAAAIWSTCNSSSTSQHWWNEVLG